MDFRRLAFTLLASVLVLACLQQTGFAVVLAYDGFDYPNDSAPVLGLNGGTGWNGAWAQSVGTAGSAGLTVSQDDTSLSSTAFPFTPIGDRVLAVGAGSGTNNTMRITRALPSALDLVNTEGVLYASFLMQKTGSSTATSNNNMELSISSATSGNGTVRLGSTSTNQFFLNTGGSNATIGPVGGVTLGTTYFLVLKVEAHTATSDVASAMVFAPGDTVPTTEPTTWNATQTFTGTVPVDNIRLWIGVQASGQFDEIHVGQTWADVTSPATVLSGDYNSDGKVDAADYVIWRKDPAGHGGDPGGYNTWRTNYGIPSGAGASLMGDTAVPEPTASTLALMMCACLCARRVR